MSCLINMNYRLHNFVLQTNAIIVFYSSVIIFLSVCLSVCLPACLPAACRLALSLSSCLSARLPVCLPGGKTVRRCLRYTDCDNSRLSQMFPALSGFTYRCCSSNLCNAATPVSMATPALALIGSLTAVWLSWL